MLESRRIRHEQDKAYSESLRIDSAKVKVSRVIVLYRRYCVVALGRTSVVSATELDVHV